MPDGSKITELTELLTASDDDVLAIVEDGGTPVTKKIKVSNLRRNPDWGNIEGDIADQTDLQAVFSDISDEIDTKADDAATTAALALKADDADLTAHEGNTSNPHSVTKSQVGLGNVDNYATASQAEAEAGSATDKFMTPQRTAQAITALASSGGVTGSVVMWTTTTAPTGWFLCDGSAKSRTTYAALFAIIGTTFGAGDGSTTFNVPDLRGRFALCKDDLGGSSANRVTATQADNIGQASGTETKNLSHTHSLTLSGNINNNGSGFQHPPSNTNSGGSSTQDIMPPYMTFAYIIKY